MGSLSGHQFGEMVSRMGSEGGFTYDPRKRSFVTSGYSVAAHKSAEMKIMHPRQVTEEHLEGYVKGSAPVWQQVKAKDRGQEMIGGWRDTESAQPKDVIDLPKVFPATPAGHSKSRRALILRNEESSFHLDTFEAEQNPWFTGSSSTPPTALSEQFPEFATMVRKKRQSALDPSITPEVAAWTEGPLVQARVQRAQRRR